MLHFKTGDMFEHFDVLDAVAQGCNTQSLMGAGVAYLFARKYPDMVEAYKEYCEEFPPEELLGDYFIWEPDDGPIIFNLFTQLVGGADARLDAIHESVEAMMNDLEFMFEGEPVDVGIPRIGAGIGGLNWEDVQDVLEECCENHPQITLIVFTLPGQFGVEAEKEDEQPENVAA